MLHKQDVDLGMSAFGLMDDLVTKVTSCKDSVPSSFPPPFFIPAL